MARHIDKTLLSFFAAAFGAIGLHRFYLRGMRDPAGWLHAASLPLSWWMWSAGQAQLKLYWAAPLTLSILTGFLMSLVYGLTRDENFDARFNPNSGKTTASRWPLALILVLSLGCGATALIAAIARLNDLFLTGGAYG